MNSAEVAALLDSNGATVLEIGQRHVRYLGGQTPLFGVMAECTARKIDYSTWRAAPDIGLGRWKITIQP